MNSARSPRSRMSYLRSKVDLNLFSIFAIIYSTAILLEMVERWAYPIPTLILLALSIFLLLRTNRYRFLIFLTVSTIYFLFFRFPDVANHVNLIIYTNIALILGLIYSIARYGGEQEDDRFYEVIQPILRLTIISTFLVSGFHKVNYDFVNPNVSCIRTVGRDIWQTMLSSFLDLGIPTLVVVGLIGAVAVGVLRRVPASFALPAVDWPAVAAPLIATLIISAALLALVGTSAIASSQEAVIFLVSMVVLCWQIVEALLLLFPRFQWAGLVLSLAVHVQLAMIAIVDFQSIALALLMSFVPLDVWRAWMRLAHIRVCGAYLHRAHVYFLLNMFAGVLMLIHNHVQPIIPRPYIVGGILFNVGVLIMLWPIISDLFSKDRSWRWEGVPVLRAATLRPLYLVPLALVLFGFTSYFGLRTAGNFSMFSNLRTEGATSNHILLGSNPLKFANYQEDVVRIIDIDDNAAKIGHKYQSLKGNSLPVVEFRKLLLQWREAGRNVPITLEYQDKITKSENIAAEPRWRVDGYDWEMRLLDFRVIQPSQPNECRW